MLLSKSIVAWDINNHLIHSLISKTSVFKSNLILVKFSQILEGTSMYVDSSNGISYLNYILYKNFSTPENNIFSSITNYSTSIQVLHNGLFIQNSYVSVYDYGVVYLLSLIFVFVVCMYRLSGRYLIIIY
jgi:hypothetical protein